MVQRTMNKHASALMDTAIRWSKESYCKRRQVGACLARGSRIISTGINGTLPGQPNQCEELEPFKTEEEMKGALKKYIVQCHDCKGSGISYYENSPYDIGDTCKTCNGFGVLRDTNVTSNFTLHAEYNAIIWGAEEGKPLAGSTLYVTLAPCPQCAKLIAAHKIAEVVYKDDYKDMSGVEYLKQCGIKTIKWPE